MESAGRVDFAARDNVGGPLEEVHGQEGKGSSGGGELDVGSRGKQAPFVRAVDGFAVEGGYADAEGGMAQCGVGEYNLNFLSELRC